MNLSDRWPPRHGTRWEATYYRPLDQTDFTELGGIAADMESQARERIGAADIRMRHFLEVRYTGQDFSLPIAVRITGPPSAMRFMNSIKRDLAITIRIWRWKS